MHSCTKILYLLCAVCDGIWNKFDIKPRSSPGCLSQDRISKDVVQKAHASGFYPNLDP